MTTATVKIAWWNTRLSPPGGNPLSVPDRVIVLEEILALLLTGVDVLGLCECAGSDVQWLRSELDGTAFDVSTFGNTGTDFQIVVIWNTSTAFVLDNEYLTDVVRGTSFRIGLRLTIAFSAGLQTDLFFSHWPSRMYHHRESGIREGFGAALRDEIDLRRQAGVQNVIVGGDFNDEPFDLSLTEGLRATRDSSLAGRKSDLLYNPFWRHIVGAQGATPKLSAPEGSYFHRGDKLNKWKMLDQMFFSRSFIGDGVWSLDEANTGVHRPLRLAKAVRGTVSKIDHLPIYAQLRSNG